MRASKPSYVRRLRDLLEILDIEDAADRHEDALALAQQAMDARVDLNSVRVALSEGGVLGAVHPATAVRSLFYARDEAVKEGERRIAALEEKHEEALQAIVERLAAALGWEAGVRFRPDAVFDAVGSQLSSEAARQECREKAQPIPLLLACPACNERHIDKGEYATKPHRTHACQHCGCLWRPANVPTVGVLFLPGTKDWASDQAPITFSMPEPRT